VIIDTQEEQRLVALLAYFLKLTWVLADESSLSAGKTSSI
jgi:hypothetical protein